MLALGEFWAYSMRGWDIIEIAEFVFWRMLLRGVVGFAGHCFLMGYIGHLRCGWEESSVKRARRSELGAPGGEV